MPLTELVEENAALSERVAKEFIAKFQGLEDEMVRRLTKLLKRFPTKGGKFVTDESTRAVLSEVKKVLEEVMRREQLREAVRDLLPEFDKIADNVSMMHGEESGIRVGKALISDTKARMIDFTTQSVIDGGYDARFTVPMTKALYEHVNFGSEVDVAERAIRSLVKGQELAPLTLDGKPRKVPGLLAQYAGQVARDSLNQFEGQVHKEIALKYELTNWRYIGNILPGRLTKSGKRVGGSRPQCVRWVNKGIITAEELPTELVWALNNGSGLIPGTTTTTWPIYRGGYNCLHTALPTRRKP